MTWSVLFWTRLIIRRTSSRWMRQRGRTAYRCHHCILSRTINGMLIDRDVGSREKRCQKLERTTVNPVWQSTGHDNVTFGELSDYQDKIIKYFGNRCPNDRNQNNWEYDIYRQHESNYWNKTHRQYCLGDNKRVWTWDESLLKKIEG